MHLAHAGMGAQHLLELVDHRRRAAGDRHAHHHRAGAVVGEVGDGDLLAPDLGLVLAAGELAADGDDRVLGEQAAGQLVGAGEQQHVDARRRGPRR